MKAAKNSALRKNNYEQDGNDKTRQCLLTCLIYLEKEEDLHCMAVQRLRNGDIMFGFLIALLSGALMSVQGVFNTQVTKTSGIWVANAFVQFTALLVCLAAWLVTDRSSFGTLFKVEPKYMLLGGTIGAFITYTVIKGMDLLGPARAVMLIVIAQLAVAYLIELFGLFGVEKQPLEVRKMVGMGVAIAGIIIFKWT